ncbi:glypican-5-like [Limulus polyphemus]|uniref:Glypican-5-like n=1 Tax=Limulus polyphemus TaxID=6850 RepID=A0ABM1C0U2_LIMPO|nr:glypican-5-like [Limulus polyphemus]
MPSIIFLNCFLAAVLLVVVSSGLSGARAEASGDLEPVNGGALCSDVRQILAKKGVSRQVPDREIKGDHLQICPSNRSCCTREMEESYKMAAKMDFRLRLQGSGSYLKMLIATSASHFLGKFQYMVKLAENNTRTLFSQTYQKMESVARLPTEQLFLDLLSYLKGKDINLEAHVDSFFRSLFPVVYNHIINPDMKEVSDDYKQCLREKTSEIKPFGDKAMLISLQIVRSFDVARSLLQALNLGVEVINTTEYMDFGTDCYNALVRLTYCAHCQRLILAKPCSGFCLNVGHGCLAQVAELDRPWNKYVSAVYRVATGMADSSNIEKVLNLLDTKISETIMHAMEDGSEITKKVKNLCGHPKRSTRSSSEVTDSEQETNGSIVTSRTVVSTWHSQLQNFVKTLTENKWFYTKLADSLCSNETFSVEGEANCWNGKEIGEL